MAHAARHLRPEVAPPRARQRLRGQRRIPHDDEEREHQQSDHEFHLLGLPLAVVLRAQRAVRPRQLDAHGETQRTRAPEEV